MLQHQKVFFLILSLVSSIRANSDPEPFDIKSDEIRFWNPQLARIAQSTFKLTIYPPGGSNAYAASGFLCLITTSGPHNVGTHYGFITVNHAINWRMIVNESSSNLGLKLKMFFNGGRDDDLTLHVHQDTTNWYTDEHLDFTFFEFKQSLTAKFMRENREFLTLTSLPKVEEDFGRQVVLFGTASWLHDPCYVGGKITSTYRGQGTIYLDIESRPGFSGAPILDRTTYQVLGVHHSYNKSGRYGVATSSESIIAKIQTYGLKAPKGDPPSLGWKLVLAVNEMAPKLHNASRYGDVRKVRNIFHDFRKRLAVSPFDRVVIRPLVEHFQEASTPLSRAAEGSHLALIEYLVKDCNAELFYQGPPANGFSPFLAAAYQGRAEVVKTMLELRSDLLESKNVYNNTALNFAAVSGHMKIVKFLVEEYGADINNRGYAGRTPVFMATDSWLVEPVKYLISKGASLDLKAENGENVLHFAVSKNVRPIVEMIVKANVTLIDVQDGNGETALHRSVYLDDFALAQFLIEKGRANLTLRNGGGKTPMLIAACLGKLKLVQYFISKGVSATDRDNAGDNVLHLAARNDHVSLVKLLLEAYHSLALVKNEKGEDVYEVADKAGSKAVSGYLKTIKRWSVNADKF